MASPEPDRLLAFAPFLGFIWNEDVQHAPIVLPERAHTPNYVRTPVPQELHIPGVY